LIDILFKKKHVHKLYKALGGSQRYYNFSLLRARCKSEPKRLNKYYILNTQEKLRTYPRAFWSFVSNRQRGHTIPEDAHLGTETATGDEVSSLFASYFASVYNELRVFFTTSLDIFTMDHFSFLQSSISVSINEVFAALDSLTTTRGSGPDGISAFLLYRCRFILYSPLTIIFSKSLAEGVFPSAWKDSRITHIFKSGNPSDVTHYRPISGLLFLGKMFEQIVLERVERTLLSTIFVDQHGFFPGRSTTISAADLISCIFEAFKAI